MIIEVHAPRMKMASLRIFDNAGREIEFTTKKIIPNLWQYQKLELETLIDGSDKQNLRISTSTARWLLRDLIKNPLFILSTLRSSFRLRIHMAEKHTFPLHISVIGNPGPIWISRNAVKGGIAPINLDESLEYDRLRNPRQYDLLIPFALIEREQGAHNLFEQTQFGLLHPQNTKSESYFTDYEILDDTRVVHGKLAIQGDKIVQISNRRFELIRRSPGWLETKGDKFQIFKPFANIGELESAIFFGSNLNWFHFIVECVTRFVAIPLDLANGTPIILESSAHNNIRQLCELLTSVPPIILRPGEEVTVRRLIIGRESGVVDTIDAGTRRAQLVEIRKRILDSHTGIEDYTSGRIYLRRPPRLFRPLQNEKKVVRLLSKYGFISVYPENESIYGLIRRLNSAEIVVVESGAAMTNLMFAKKDLKVLELNPGDGGFGFWGRFLDIFAIKSAGIVGKRQVIGARGVAIDGYRIPLKKIEKVITEMLSKSTS
jgi:hypothetical protein